MRALLRQASKHREEVSLGVADPYLSRAHRAHPGLSPKQSQLWVAEYYGLRVAIESARRFCKARGWFFALLGDHAQCIGVVGAAMES
eukprot:8171044-Alexandrium_andersonii.AAC.1